ncbi:MAG: hypothetical protein LBD41_04250 [Clostridiales Family XIII bacterium]|jgi:hypothetical protein|nr:hypothetical protein [Clostridiales Family XIII bacterium]
MAQSNLTKPEFDPDKGNYVTFNNWILRDKRVSCKARGLYATICNLPKEWQLKGSSLNSILPEDLSTIYRYLKELTKYGYLSKENNRKNGKFLIPAYTVHKKSICEETKYDNDN